MSSLIISHLTLRILIGVLGCSLPIVLILGCLIRGDCTTVQDSISAYYYTPLRDVFVGFLFVLGFFLLTYKGYRGDNIVANIGFVFALGVALFPHQSGHIIIKVLHFVCAGLLFGVFAYFALVLFRKGDDNPTNQKKRRNLLYLICGILIIVFISFIPLSMVLFTDEALSRFNLTFWFEALAMWSFGFSWLVKGGILWRDATGLNS